MDTDKLIPLDVAIRELEIERLRVEQQKDINKKLNKQQFDRGMLPSEKGSAFNDSMASAYAKVKTNKSKMKNDMVHATSSSPYLKENTYQPRQVSTPNKSNNVIEAVFTKDETPVHNKKKKLNEDLRWGVKPRLKPKGNSNWGI